MTEIEFLKARLDELEGIARESLIIANLGVMFSPSAPIVSNVDVSHAAHITTWTPEFALAQIAAQRKIIEISEEWPLLVEGQPVFGFDGHGDETAMTMSQQIAWTTNQKYREVFGDEPPTTPVIRALIQPFSDHPDFEPSWRMA